MTTLPKELTTRRTRAIEALVNASELAVMEGKGVRKKSTAEARRRLIAEAIDEILLAAKLESEKR